MGTHYGRVAGKDGKRGFWVLGGLVMRRAILLAVGFGAGFCVLWALLVNAQSALAYQWDTRPVLSVLPGEGAELERDEEMALPVSVPGTCLVVEQIVMYEGPFLEDDSGREVVNVAALLLRNTGEFGVESARVVLEAGALQFVFEADTIPAGQAVLVLEKGGKEYGPRTFTGCTGWAVCCQEDWSGVEMLDIQSVDMGTVRVTNQTDKVLAGILLHYKNYLADPGFFVGGRTYLYLIERLEPGQTIYIYPSHYANGYSRFARVEVEKIQ